MKSEQLMKFKAIFESQKQNLLATSKYINEDFAVKSEELADELDLSSAELEQNMKMRLRSRETLFLKKINESLFKIQSGSFGVCEGCEEDIELSRLEVRPTATLCISCKESEEMNEHRSADGRMSKSMGIKTSLRIA